MTSKTVVTYTRVSSEGQDTEDKVSIAEQQADIDERITRNGWTVAASLSDAERYVKTKSPNKGKRVQPSGEYDDRPGFVAMLEMIKQGGIDAIVCWRDDRLMRHTRVYSAVEDALDEADKVRQGRPPVEIYDATGNKLDRFVLGIKAQIGREENKRRVERVKMGKIGTLKRGLWPGMYRRLGYVTEKAERGNRIVLGPENEVQTVKNIFDWYDSGVSVKQISQRLIADDRPQRKQPNGKKLREWGLFAIHNILRSKDYTGIATWEFNDGTPAMVIDIPQIISPELFRRVQKRLIENQRKSSRNTKGVFLLQNLAACGGCGNRLSAVVNCPYYYVRLKDGTVKRYNRKTDRGYRYYCAFAARYPEEPHTHPYVFTGADLDTQFWQYVANRMVTHPELIIEQVQNRQAELRAQDDNLDSEITRKHRQIATIEQDRMTYTRQLGRGKIKESVYDSLMTECDENEADLKEQLDYLLTLRDDQKKVKTAIERVERLLANISQRLPEINQSPKELASLPEARQRAIMLERQTIIKSLCEKVIVYANGDITIQGLIEVSNFDIASPTTDYHKILYFLSVEAVA